MHLRVLGVPVSSGSREAMVSSVCSSEREGRLVLPLSLVLLLSLRVAMVGWEYEEEEEWKGRVRSE